MKETLKIYYTRNAKIMKAEVVDTCAYAIVEK